MKIRKAVCMNDDEFVLLLQKATQNDKIAIYEIIKMYENLTIKNSIVNGRFDEDCRVYIESNLITAINNFKIF